MPELKRVRIDRCMVGPNVPAGMNILVVASLVYMYRSSNEDAPPIQVTREGRYYRVVDGRHRMVASLIAGRRRVLAKVLDMPI